jgi:dynein heavy chain
MDYGGWYEIDTNDKEFRRLEGVKFVACMGPPGGGRNDITPRYVRHFNVIYVEPYSNASMTYIFSNVLEWFYQSHQSPMFSKGVSGQKENLVANTLHLYDQVAEKFKPTPAKSHYTYNLRDVSKVFQGVCRTSPKAI